MKQKTTSPGYPITSYPDILRRKFFCFTFSLREREHGISKKTSGVFPLAPSVIPTFYQSDLRKDWFYHCPEMDDVKMSFLAITRRFCAVVTFLFFGGVDSLQD
ncbi:hypothetical protein TNCT_688541 [Trichonephila clavata]|uniref:Uncharacterized protein n=1 Tax=Trichonephila clavata TaxID=2740835 RepID=A0A8X6GS16_TRICU|nr:hypothetical protein TNCT_688541 [Trichonephila clavata]